MKYAVVNNGRNQLCVAEGKKVLVDSLGLEKGKKFTWDQVLLFRNEDKIEIGNPYIKDLKIIGTICEEVKGPKVVNFKKKRRKGYKRKIGHRQKFTEILVEEIKK